MAEILIIIFLWGRPVDPMVDSYALNWLSTASIVT